MAEYEDLEEQNKLLKLPCAVGDVAYRINKGAKAKLIAMRVQDVKIFQVGGILSVKIGCVEDVYGGECNYLAEEIGRKVFLSREEAEAVLKELKMGCGTGKVQGIFCLNSECENYFEDNCMKIFEEGTVNISKEGRCEDFKEGEYEGYVERIVKEKWETLIG